MANSDLKKLIEMFITSHTIVITNREIRSVNKYLFKNGALTCLPMFVDKELYETVVYLKEMVELKNFKNIHDIRAYYTRLRNDMMNNITDWCKNNPPDKE